MAKRLSVCIALTVLIRSHLFACLRLDSRFLENSEESARTHKVDIETMKTHKIGSCFRMCDDNYYN
jgi:hypothetical protein